MFPINVGECAGEATAVKLTVRNPSDTAREELVRASVPLGQGQMATASTELVDPEGRREDVQARVITTHADGSPRRVMLSFVARLGPGESKTYTYGEGGNDQSAPAIMEQTADGVSVRTGPYRLALDGDHLRLLSGGGEGLAVVRAYGPEVKDAAAPTSEIIEAGPYFGWYRWRQEGEEYAREVDVEADVSGRIRLTQRILRKLRENDWTRDFGFEVTATGAETGRVPGAAVGFLGLGADDSFASCPDLVCSLRLADGAEVSMANPLALRQRRGSLEATSGEQGVTVRASRVEPVEQENDNLMIQEGMWRVMSFVLQPGAPDALAAALDQPLVAAAHWQAYDAVYHTGPPLQVKHPVLKRLDERYRDLVVKMSIDGDDWGNVTSYSELSNSAGIFSMLRYNHCQYVWEDYFRTGDPDLRRTALDWSENYRNFSIYWGPEAKYYGGGRYPHDQSKQPWPGTYMVRFNNGVNFCTKGYHSFWLAYEESGDPRFKQAAQEQAKWSSTNVHANQGEMRNVGMVIDYVKLYEYTAEGFYLEQAVRLWDEFKEKQQPDLMFTQSGKPATGNELYIPNDEYGYKYPFYKSYITQYATNALVYMLKHRPDDTRLRETIIACNDWMVSAQTPGGGWSYPGPSTGGLNWSTEYCHGLMLGCRVEPKPSYLDAAQRDLRAIALLFAVHDIIPGGITAWERGAGLSQDDMIEMYKYGRDRDRHKDFTDGQASLGWLSPDGAVYFGALLREYLKHRDEASVFAQDAVADLVLTLPTNLPAVSAGGGEAGGEKPKMMVTAVNPDPDSLPTLGVWQSEDGAMTHVAATFPDVPDFRCDSWLYESGGIVFEGATALSGGRLEVRHTWEDHPQDVVTIVTPEPGAVEFDARLVGEGAEGLERGGHPSLNMCWQLRNAPAFASRPEPYPEFVKRCFVYTDEGMTLLHNTVRKKIPCREPDDNYNNPPWVQMYVGVWARIPEVTPKSWADYSDDRYVVPIIGAVSRDGKYLTALANDSANTMAQAWHDCMHNNPPWVPAPDGKGYHWRTKVYVMANDGEKLLERAEQSFPNLRKLQEKRVPPKP